MANEEQRINYLIHLFEDHTKEVREELAEIKRGLYGDERNQFPGLIQRQAIDEAEIEKLKSNQKKALWIGTGFFTALQAAGIWVYELFKK